MLAARAAWILSAFTVGIYVARKLGPYNFGVLNYAIALAGIFSIIAGAGVEQIVSRQLVREPSSRDRVLGNFFMLRLILLAAMGTALGITLWRMQATVEVKVLCVIAGVGYVGRVVEGGGLYFQSTVQSKLVAIPQLISCLVNSLVRGLAAYFDWPLAVFAMAEASNLVVYDFGSLFLYWRRVDSPWRWNWAWAEIWILLKQALPLAMVGVFGVVYARTDQLMVEHFLGPAAVGYYSLATRFTENWAIVAGLLCGSFFPAVVTAAQISKDAYRKQLHRLYFLVFWSMAGAAAVTVMLGRPVILLLFGQDYLPSAPVLGVFVWTLLGTALLNVFSLWAVNEKRLALIAWSFGSGAFINAFMNPLLIDLVGINGAAYSSLISMPLGLVLSLIWQSDGREHLRLMFHSILTLPSFRLGEHPA
jgi:O-antigen/teichoic acid export membrane protein